MGGWFVVSKKISVFLLMHHFLSSFLSLCSFVNRWRCAGNADSPVSLHKGLWCCEDASAL